MNTTVNQAINDSVKVTYAPTVDGYCMIKGEIELANFVRKRMVAILKSDTLSTRQNLRNYKYIIDIAKTTDLSVHVKIGKYNMDVMSKNSKYLIIIRCPTLMVYNDNGKLITEKINSRVISSARCF